LTLKILICLPCGLCKPERIQQQTTPISTGLAHTAAIWQIGLSWKLFFQQNPAANMEQRVQNKAIANFA
jgi:hypothetical protein